MLQAGTPVDFMLLNRQVHKFQTPSSSCQTNMCWQAYEILCDPHKRTAFKARGKKGVCVHASLTVLDDVSLVLGGTCQFLTFSQYFAICSGHFPLLIYHFDCLIVTGARGRRSITHGYGWQSTCATWSRITSFREVRESFCRFVRLKWSGYSKFLPTVPFLVLFSGHANIALIAKIILSIHLLCPTTGPVLGVVCLLTALIVTMIILGTTFVCLRSENARYTNNWTVPFACTPETTLECAYMHAISRCCNFVRARLNVDWFQQICPSNPHSGVRLWSHFGSLMLSLASASLWYVYAKFPAWSEPRNNTTVCASCLQLHLLSPVTSLFDGPCSASTAAQAQTGARESGNDVKKSNLASFGESAFSIVRMPK